MTETFDMCVIGGGSAGLSVAAGAAQMGARVALAEKGAMGGDCLNTGCVPSKALIAAAHAAHAGRHAARLGIDYAPPRVDFARVRAHVQGTIAAIAPHDSVERFEGLGVRVIAGAARFVDARHVVVDGETGDGEAIRARRFVIATGSRARIPPIPGLETVPFLTNETVFALEELPSRLVVIGGGPIGLELAHAFARLGSAVIVLERFAILPKDEPEAVAVVRAALAADGVAIHENVEIGQVSGEAGRIAIVAAAGGEPLAFEASHILVAAGRAPNVEHLGLSQAGIAASPSGITVDAGLRTTNRRVYAIGDVAGGPQFTHVAAHHAGIVIRNALFLLPAKVDYRALPWVTYTDPELAHVGLTERDARAAHTGVTTIVEPFARNDRAQAEAATDGLLKLVLNAKARVLGATVVGPGAGEAIGFFALAIARRAPLSAIAGLILPYPTRSEIAKRAAGAHFTPTIYGPRVRRLVGWTQRLFG